MRREDLQVRIRGIMASDRRGRCPTPCLCRARRIASASVFSLDVFLFFLWTFFCFFSGLWTLDSGLWTLDPGPWTASAGEWPLRPLGRRFHLSWRPRKVEPKKVASHAPGGLMRREDLGWPHGGWCPPAGGIVARRGVCAGHGASRFTAHALAAHRNRKRTKPKAPSDAPFHRCAVSPFHRCAVSPTLRRLSSIRLDAHPEAMYFLKQLESALRHISSARANV